MHRDDDIVQQAAVHAADMDRPVYGTAQRMQRDAPDAFMSPRGVREDEHRRAATSTIDPAIAPAMTSSRRVSRGPRAMAGEARISKACPMERWRLTRFNNP